MPGGFIGAVGKAAGISLINVGVLACAAGLLIRRIHYKAWYLRAAAWSGLAATLFLALAWNLAAGHYRDTLEGNEAPSQSVESRTDPTTEAGADAQAVIRFKSNPLQLSGFGSYLLFLVGLGLFGLAAWKWLELDDPFPGYGAHERRRLERQKALDDKRHEILTELDKKLVDGRNKVDSVFEDPVERWNASIAAIRGRSKLFLDHREDIRQENIKAEQAITMYRIANRQARSAESMIPPHWDSPYKYDVTELPQCPPEIRIYPLDYALDLREKELKLLRSYYSKLNRTHDACACRVLSLSFICHGGSPRSMLELELGADQSEILDAIRCMGSRDGKLGIPDPNHAGLGISEASIRMFYSISLADSTKCYHRDLQVQADLMDSRLLTNSTERTVDYEQEQRNGQVAQAELQAIHKEVYAGLVDLHEKAQDAVDSFHKVKAAYELATVNKASGSDRTAQSNLPTGDYSHSKSAADIAVAALCTARDQALMRLTDSYNRSRSKLGSSFQNAVEVWEATDRAVRESSRLYASYTSTADQLNTQCREAIELYRTANTESRRDGMPPPVHWSDAPEVDLDSSESPPRYNLCSYEVAKQIHQNDQLALETQLDALTACYNDYHHQVMQLTELYNG